MCRVIRGSGVEGGNQDVKYSTSAVVTDNTGHIRDGIEEEKRM